MARSTLSLCMIVKNEEEMLPELLASVDGLWDEFIVADTGSTDNTIALLKAAGAQVVNHVWQDDFAAARNASLAGATSDWIMFLDADERVTPLLAEQIAELLTDPTAGAATVVLRNDLPGGLHREAHLLRLFRNEPGVRFEHRIHEDVSACVGANLARNSQELRALSGIVTHLGYVKEVAAAKDKKARDLHLLEKSVAQNPQDFYCWFKILEQARFWNDNALWQETAMRAEAQWLEASANLQMHPWSGELAALISQGLYDDSAKSLSWLEQKSSLVSKNGPYVFRQGILLESLGRLAEAEAAFTQCLDFSDHDGAHLSKVRPLLGICRIAAAGGDISAAARHARQAAQTAPRDPEALVALVMFVGLAEGQDCLASLVADHVAGYQDTAIALAQALLTCGQITLAKQTLTKALPHNEEAALGLLALSLIEGRDWNGEIKLTQEAADMAFQAWVTTLLQSRQEPLIAGFMHHCAAVFEFFPWLPNWLNLSDQ